MPSTRVRRSTEQPLEISRENRPESVLVRGKHLRVARAKSAERALDSPTLTWRMAGFCGAGATRPTHYLDVSSARSIGLRAPRFRLCHVLGVGGMAYLADLPSIKYRVRVTT